MRLFFVILLLFFYTSTLKANNIYNLIKIPNLKIYEINTINKLKYFYAERSFQLGVDKNIKCYKANKKNLNSNYEIIKKNLNKYNSSFLKKINLKYIVLCENLSISGIYTAGIPDHIMKTLILDIKFNEKYFERIIHHEVFHIINDSFKDLFNEDEWKKFNNKEFKYSECSTCTKKWGLKTLQKTNGFFTDYSQSIPSEDMAEVFSHLMIQYNKTESDPILKKKEDFIKEKILKIDNNFEF